MLVALCGRSMDTHVNHVADRPGHDRRYAVDARKLHALGWKPRRPFAEGLAAHRRLVPRQRILVASAQGPAGETNDVKGIILAGGLGTRLHPLTKVTNKHLLPVYDRPMIYYPLQTLCDAGIHEVMIVTGGNSAGDFLRLLGNGAEFGLRGIYYAYQEGEAGIADALRLCENFADGRPIVVLLGDNIFQRRHRAVRAPVRGAGIGARILLKEVDDLQRFGVPVFDGERIVEIEEKPAKPKSRFAVTGVVYVRRAGLRVYPRARTVVSGRVRNRRRQQPLHSRGTSCSYDVLDGWWSDAGTFESLFRAGELVARRRETATSCGNVNRQ